LGGAAAFLGTDAARRLPEYPLGVSDACPRMAPAVHGMGQRQCQYCGTTLHTTWADLGLQPLANSYSVDRETARTLAAYPLHARYCHICHLVQVDRAVPAEAIFSDYPYFSSYSWSWLAHCRNYAGAMIQRFDLGSGKRVIEIGSNDGYLLKYFAEAGLSVLGIDPAGNIAEIARNAGIPTETAFFGLDVARDLVARGISADHLSAKNVLAHVPDIRDFVEGVAVLLRDEAVFTVEFPHLLQTIRGLQFDQIYHEHYCYLSLLALQGIFREAGLRIFDVEELTTHGGSLRVYACRSTACHETSSNVDAVLAAEIVAQLDDPAAYRDFERKLRGLKADFLGFIANCHDAGKRVVGYGAAAKANTFLNYCGASPDTLAYIADRSSSKVRRFMPGSGIPIVEIVEIKRTRPDYIAILPWNLRQEIVGELGFVRRWGGRFVTAIPAIEIF